MFLGASPAPAQLFWDTVPAAAGPQGGTGNWIGTNFWNSGPTNTAWVQGATAVFTSAPGTVTVNGSVTAAALSFAVDGYTVDGPATLTLTGAGALTVSDAADTAMIAAPVGGTVGLVKTGAGTVTLSGALANTYSGVAAVADGTLNLNKTAGTLGIPGNLTIGDGTGTANSAMVHLGQNNQIANTSIVTINEDGVWDLAISSETVGGVAMTGGNLMMTSGFGQLTLGGNVTANASAAQANINGAINLGGATRTFDVADGGASIDLSVPALISNGSLTKSGPGTLRLRGTNTFSGSVTINGGVLDAGELLPTGASGALGTGSLIVLNGGTLRSSTAAQQTNRAISLGATGGSIDLASPVASLFASGTISGGGALTKLGSGELVLAGTNTFTGGVTLNDGVLNVGTVANTGSNSNLGAGNSISFGGGTLAFTGNVGTTNRAVTLNAGGGVVDVKNPTATLTLSGTIGGTGPMTKAGAGTLRMTGPNTASGALTIDAGVLAIPGGNAIGDNAGVLLGGSSAALSVESGAETIGSLAGGAAPGALVVLAAGSTLVLGNDNSSTAFGGRIVGPGNLTKVGTGTFTMTGENSYTGTTTVNQGILSVPAGGGIDDFAAVVLANATGVSLNIGGSETIGSLAGGGSTGGNVSIAASRTLTVGLNGTATTYGGAISGAGNFAKQGAGTLTLTGTNTYTGNTDVLGGTLRLAGGNAIPDGSTVTISAPGAVDLNGSAETISNLSGNGAIALGAGTLTLRGSGTFSGSISGSGSVTKTDAFLVTLNGNNTYTGTTTITAGAVAISGGFALPDESAVVLPNASGTSLIVSDSETVGSLAGVGNVTISSGMTLRVGADQTTTTYGGVISGNALVKIGAGTLTLTGGNTFTGSLTIEAGALSVPAVFANGPLGNGSLINFGGNGTPGRLIFTGTGSALTNRTISLANDGIIDITAAAATLTLSGQVTGGGSLSKVGPGTLVLSGSNNFAGRVLIQGGVLRTSGGTALPDDSAVELIDAAGVAFDQSGASETIGSLAGGGSTGGNVTLGNGTLTVGANQIDSSFSGAISGAGGLTKIGTGTLTLLGSSSYTGTTIVSGGTLALASPAGTTLADSGAVIVNSPGVLELLSNETLASLGGNGAVRLTNGTLIIAGTNAVGYSGSISGPGGLTRSGTGTLTLVGPTNHTGATTITGGTLSLNNGLGNPGAALVVTSPGTLQARNVVNRSVSGSGTIAATGTLIIGDAAAPLGFAFGGTLAIGGNTVVLMDANTADLGIATTLDAGGRLDSLNGTFLPSGRSITVNAAVSAGISGAFVNSGIVNGPTAAGQFLTFTDDVNGIGSYTGNIIFSDGFSPGASAAAVSMENFAFDSASTLNIELGGVNAGSDFDRINFTGAGTLDGSLAVSLINGFNPQVGDTFVFIQGGALGGAFDAMSLPVLNGDLSWSYVQSPAAATLQVVPEPTAASLVIAASVLGVFRRRDAQRHRVAGG